MSELEQLRSDIYLYDGKYEALYLDIKNHTNVARKLVRGVINTPTLEETAFDLALCNQKLVECVAMAGSIFRGAQKFYYITKQSHKDRLIKEKNIAEEAAESEALALSIEEFTVMDQAAYSYDIAVRRWQSTETMINTLLIRLGYGKTQSNTHTSAVHPINQKTD